QEKDVNFTFFKNGNSGWICHLVTPIRDRTLVQNIQIHTSKWNCGDHLAIIGELNTNDNITKQFCCFPETYYKDMRLLTKELYDNYKQHLE
ncbi:unnamed protein product, partial [Brachionus calyciflorus]